MLYFVHSSRCIRFLREARKIANKLLVTRNLRFLKVDQKLCLDRKKIQKFLFQGCRVSFARHFVENNNVLLIVIVGFKIICHTSETQ